MPRVWRWQSPIRSRSNCVLNALGTPLNSGLCTLCTFQVSPPADNLPFCFSREMAGLQIIKEAVFVLRSCGGAGWNFQELRTRSEAVYGKSKAKDLIGNVIQVICFLKLNQEEVGRHFSQCISPNSRKHKG